MQFSMTRTALIRQSQPVAREGALPRRPGPIPQGMSMRPTRTRPQGGEHSCWGDSGVTHTPACLMQGPQPALRATAPLSTALSQVGETGGWAGQARPAVSSMPTRGLALSASVLLSSRAQAPGCLRPLITTTDVSTALAASQPARWAGGLISCRGAPHVTTASGGHTPV